jgi:ribonuclease Z
MILVDCGEGTQIPLKMAEWGFKTIDAVLFTHYHADHIAGLTGFLLTLGNSGREEPLTLMGPPGLLQVIRGLTVIAPELPYELQVVELPDNNIAEYQIGSIIIRSMPADHNIPCVSYCLELKRQGRFDAERAQELNIPKSCWSRLQKGETIALEDRVLYPEMVLGEPRKGIKVSYCTDTRPVNELVSFVAESDLFICEGMYGDPQDSDKAIMKKHMTFREAALIAKQANVSRLWLTHYSPSLTEPELFIDVARAIFPNTSAGKDLLKTTLYFEK